MRTTAAVVIAIVAGTLLQDLPAQTEGTPESLQQTSPQTTSLQTTTGQANSAKPETTGKQKPQKLMQGKVSQQKRRRHQSATTAVHSAWLTEIIDLDRKTAIEEYNEIIEQSTKKQPEKWIAVARLQELSRLGVLRPEPLATPGQVPPEVRKALELLSDPFPFAKVLRDPEANTELPPVRPATPLVQDWVRNQTGPTVRERFRPSRGLSTAPVIRPEWLRYYARDVMKLELEGNRTKANALRGLFFVEFKPMAVTGSRAELFATAMKRLAKLIEEESWPRARNDLRKYENDLRTLAKNESTPAAGAHLAIELIRRIPYYSTKLLASPEAAATKQK
jgi:hypothetical protein